MSQSKQFSISRMLRLLERVRRCVFHEILEKIEELLDDCEHGRHHRARRLRFTFSWCGQSIQGDHMQFNLVVGQSVSVIGSPVQAGLDANGNPIPSSATLSAVAYTSSDPSVFTVAPDPGTPNGAIITSVGAGTATLTETATATEPDGTTTEQIQGVATGVVTAAPPPPPPPASSIVFTFGTPFPTPPANPPTV